MFGIKQPDAENKEKRFAEKERQIIGGCKEIIVFVDTYTGVEYMTSSSSGSDILMMRDRIGDPLTEDGYIR